MKPITWLAILVAVGIALAEWLRPHPLLPLAGLFLLLPCCLRWPKLALGAALLAGLFVKGYSATAGAGTIGHWAAKTVAVVGRVATAPVEKSYELKVESVDGAAASGRLRVTQRAGALPAPGAVVSVRGKVTERPDGFRLSAPTAEILRQPRIQVAYWLRSHLNEAIKKGLPPKEAALLAGLLFGTRTDLPAEWDEAFRRTGTLHILVASGSNVVLVLTPVFWLRGRLGARRAAFLAIPLAILYWFLTEGEPSVSRATVMVVVTLLGQALGRETHPITSLSAAVCGLLLVDPQMLTNIGFQLSVAATLGILLFTRPIQQWLTDRLRLPVWLGAPLAVTLAAQTLTEPLTLHYFGAVSLVAPLANLPVGWIVNYLVQGAFALSILALVFPPLLLLAYPGIWLLVLTVKLFASMPGAFALMPPLPWAGVLLWYGALVALFLPWPRRRLLAGVLAALCMMGWPVAYARAPGLLRVTFIDVGQGDAILVQMPDGATLLIDAGPASEGWSAGEARVLPFLRREGIGRLTYALVTHGDQDHVGGMPAVLRAVPATILLEPGVPSDSLAYQELMALPMPVRRPTAGEAWRHGAVTVEVLGPPAERLHSSHSETNANSILLRIRYGDTAVLLTADAEPETEQWLLASGADLRADVLKVSHHGSGRSSTEPFLAAVQPTIAVVQTGPNTYGHPSPKALERLEAAGARVYRTDHHGNVTVESDGRTVRVSHTRRAPLPAMPLLRRPLVGAW